MLDGCQALLWQVRISVWSGAPGPCWYCRWVVLRSAGSDCPWAWPCCLLPLPLSLHLLVAGLGLRGHP